MAKMIKMTKYIIVCALLALPLVSSAQTDREHIRTGNKLYRQKSFAAAEVEYRKALSAKPDNPQAMYNLGCAMMMQNKASEAVKFYEKAATQETNKLRKAKIYHNIGVICQSGKMYAEAIKAYCESLRNNPNDNETRYNLALCKKLLKNNNNKNNKNNKKNQKDQNQKGNDKRQDQKNDSGKNDKKDQKSDSQQQKQPQMSKDNAEQLLNAAMQQEQQTQERLNRNRQQQQSRHFEKNW